MSYNDRWDLTRLRQAEISVPHYCVIDKDGLLIDVAGFIPQLRLHVAPIKNMAAFQTVSVPETGEPWRLLIHHLKDGVAILGVLHPEDVTNVDDRLIKAEKHLGSSVAEALLVNVDTIDIDVNYAIIDENGRIRAAYGDIPLKVIKPPGPVVDKVNEVTSKTGISYGIEALPFKDKTGRIVGKVVVFDKMPPKPWRSWPCWAIFFLSSTLLAAIAAFFLPKARPHDGQIEASDLAGRIKGGETKTLEFKANLRWNSFKKDFDPQIENSILKTIVAFCNTEGGDLLIGVADNGAILGIEKDGFKNPDKFLLHLRNLIVDRIIPKTVIDCIDYEIMTLEGKLICLARCISSSEDVWLKPDPKTAEQFFVRSGPSSTPLSPKEAVAYIQRRFKKTKAPLG